MDELAAEEDASVAAIISDLYDHCEAVNDKNLTSCLRVLCLKYINLGL